MVPPAAAAHAPGAAQVHVVADSPDDHDSYPVILERLAARVLRSADFEDSGESRSQAKNPSSHLTEDFFHQLAASLGPHQLHGACTTERPAELAQPQERLFVASEHGFSRGQYLHRTQETVRFSRLEAFPFPATVGQRAGRHDPVQFAPRESRSMSTSTSSGTTPSRLSATREKGWCIGTFSMSPIPASALAETFPTSRPDRWNCPDVLTHFLRCIRQYAKASQAYCRMQIDQWFHLSSCPARSSRSRAIPCPPSGLDVDAFRSKVVPWPP